MEKIKTDIGDYVVKNSGKISDKRNAVNNFDIDGYVYDEDVKGNDFCLFTICSSKDSGVVMNIQNDNHTVFIKMSFNKEQLNHLKQLLEVY